MRALWMLKVMRLLIEVFNSVKHTLIILDRGLKCVLLFCKVGSLLWSIPKCSETLSARWSE